MKRFLCLLMSSWMINAYCADYEWNGTGATPNVATAGNWIPSGPPGASDTGIFAAFSGVSFTPVITGTFSVGTFDFTDSSTFTFDVTAGNTVLSFEQLGIVSGSGTQIFNYGGSGSDINFNNSSSAGNAIFNIAGAGAALTELHFNDTSTAGSATLNVSNAGITFFNTPTSQNATFNLNDAGAEAAIRTGGGVGTSTFNATAGAAIIFQNNATASEGIFNLSNGSLLNVTLSATPTLGALSGTSGTSVNLANSIFVGANNSSTVFAGSITDLVSNSTFTKVGTGTLTLSGTNTSTGETVASAGILDLTGSIAGTAVASGGTFNISGSVAMGASVSAGILNVLSGGSVTGGATVSGGTFNVLSGGTVTGNATGSGGTLNILTGGIVTGNAVASGGIINLTGTVQSNGSVSGGGTFYLNGSILGNFVADAGGTVGPSTGTVAGTYTQNAGSFFLVNSTTPLEVTGGVTLNGGEVEVADVVLPNTPFSILHSATSVTGAFSGAFSFNPHFRASLTYGPNDVFLSLSTQFVLPGMTPNQTSLANQLNNLNPADPEQAALLAALLSLSGAAYTDALDQLSGVQYADLIHLDTVTNRRFLRTIYDPFRPDFVCPCSMRCCEDSVTWSNVQGGQDFMEHDSNAKGLDGYDIGASVGTHRYFTPSLAIGIAGNYTYNHVTFEQAGTGNGNSYLGALYGMCEAPCGYLFGEAVGGYTHWDIRRPIAFDSYRQTAIGKLHVSHLALYGETGANVWVKCFLVQPFVGLEYGHYWRSTTNENGAAAATLVIENQNIDDLQTRLGTHLSATYGNFLVSVDAAWRHRYSVIGDNLPLRFDSFGSDFTTLGPELGRDSFDGELYIGTRICDNMILYLTGFGEVGSRNSDYAITLGLQKNW